MAKNEAALTVSVLNENDEVIGKTYSKRARGLLKNGRAELVSDDSIRLKESICPTCENTEELKMDNNYIYFDTKTWQKSSDSSGRVERFFITNPMDNDKLNEVYSLSGWLDGSLCKISSGWLTLEKNTEYHFVFWLNGGENDKQNETCQCLITFSNSNKSNAENRLVYNLNRNYIKPIKQYNGWRLYDIIFTTSDKKLTQISFCAQLAPTAIMPASSPKNYTFEDVLDEYVEHRPQRHNICFDDGWPRDTWYSTVNLRQKCEQRNEPNINIDYDEIAERVVDSIDIGAYIDYDDLAENLDILDIIGERINEAIENLTEGNN